jgi:hypothetical protein
MSVWGNTTTASSAKLTPDLLNKCFEAVIKNDEARSERSRKLCASLSRYEPKNPKTWTDADYGIWGLIQQAAMNGMPLIVGPKQKKVLDVWAKSKLKPVRRGKR